jgi:hypothetical protein
MNPIQRAYLLKRVGSLPADFEKLSCNLAQIKPNPKKKETLELKKAKFW